MSEEPALGAPSPPVDPAAAFNLDITGFEGPLDLLLTLAKGRRIDLAEVAMAELAEAYLAWLAEARRRRLDVAADYLVMAAWLAYLKSRLLLPEPEPDEVPADDLARALAFRLKRLEAMRNAADTLFARDMVGRDVFVRGAPEATVVDREVIWQAGLADLLAAYCERRQREMASTVTFAARTVWSLVDARERLERLVGTAAGWVPLEDLLAALPPGDADPRSVRASVFGAGLELAREGRLAISQGEPFGPLYMKEIAARRDDEGETP